MKQQHFSWLNTRLLPLQWVLVIPFVLQIFGAVSLVGYLSFKNGEKAVQDLAEQLITRTGSQVHSHLDDYLAIPHQLSQINADAIRMGLLDVSDRASLGKYFWHQIQAYNISYIGIGLTTGGGLGSGYYDGQTMTIDDWDRSPSKITTYATNNQGERTEVLDTYEFDNFSSPWYTEPISKKRPTWSHIYTIYIEGSPYIGASAGRPIYDSNDQLLGIVAADIHLLKLSEFLRTLEISQSGQAFILEVNGMLVANSAEDEPFLIENQKIQRIKATDSTNPVIQSLAQQIQEQIPNLETLTETQELRIKFEGEPYYVQIAPWRDPYGLEWLVVTSVPESHFMAQINANTRTTLWLCVAALAGATGIGIFTSRGLVVPILRVSEASQAVAIGNLDQVLTGSNIRELNTLAHAFNQMAERLRQSFTALEAGKAELEHRVVERTAELQQAKELAEAAHQAKSESLSQLNQEMMERQQTEIALKEQTNLMQLILNSMSDGVIVSDEKGQFLIFNPAAEQMFDKGVTETQQEEWAEQYGLFQVDGITPLPTDQIPLVRTLRGEQVDNVEIFTRHRQAPQGIWVIASGRPIKDANGVLKGGVVVCRDISDRKCAELDLLKAKETAEIANRTKSEFLANMNHELRTPLNGVLGYAQILQRDPATTPKQMKGLGVIHQCASHLLTLINDILDLSKLEVQKMELYPQDFHLSNFLAATVDICRVKAEQKGVEFHYQPGANLPTAVHSDDKRLRQVLLNLLSNAIKFTDFGTVTFRVEPVDGPTQSDHTCRIRFLVKDTGIGIAPDKLATIFLPFEQAGKRDRNTEGTGLGLAISQQIVEKMGSTIQAESVLGQGSCFSFEVDLSLASDWVTHNGINNQKIIGYQGKRRTILVIDDHPENRSVVVNMLEPLGFKMVEAADGQMGFNLAIQIRPDLIITDVAMSRMDGLEMTRNLRALPDFVNTTIIASPATLSQVDMQESLDAGCTSFFPKPVDYMGLLAELQRLLQLQWIYETAPETPSVPTPESTDAEFILPPPEELKALQRAAQGGFMADIQQEAERIKQLSVKYVAFANRVLELSQQFDDEAILALIES
jgi:PAS domain S-box-containing protein